MTEEEHMYDLIQSANEAHARMFTASSESEALERFREAKRDLEEAIALAENQGDSSKVVWLENRLVHMGGILRSQLCSLGAGDRVTL